LLIAAFNFINLSTAQSVQRGREMGMRKVLGSSRNSLIAQILGETLLITVFAAGISLLITPQVLQMLKAYIPDGVVYSVVRPEMPAFAAGAALATTLLAGFYPAWVMSAYRPAMTLKGPNALKGNQKGYVRKTLIVFQFTFSLIFIIGTIIIGRQLDYIRHKDLGFTTDAIVLLDTQNDDKSAVLAEKIRGLSGVEGVTMQWFAPMGENYMLTRMKYNGGPTPVEMDVSAKSGDEQFIPLYGLRLVAGRNYPAGDTLREFVVNQSFTKALGFQQPDEALGKLLELNGRSYPIAGVVADFHEQSLHAPIKPAFIAHLAGMSKNLGIKLQTQGKHPGDMQATLDAIAAQWAQVFPDKKFEYTFLDESIAKVYVKERKAASIVQGATAVAILISCMGLFGLITFMSEQRSKEIGIRKVLGASVASVVGLLSVDFLKLILISLALASPIAWYFMQKWLTDFAYRIDIQGWMFALAGAAAIGIAFLTIGFQSIRAALANPVESLRSE
jgi:ABC-type antimicrobial peptide transport system permease subunit